MEKWIYFEIYYFIRDRQTSRGGVDMITDEDVAYFKGMRDGVEWMIEKLKERELKI